MDKKQIKQVALRMKSKDDLLNLLNRIKRDEMDELGFADKFHPFMAKHMNYYCNPKNASIVTVNSRLKRNLAVFDRLRLLATEVSCSCLTA